MIMIFTWLKKTLDTTLDILSGLLMALLVCVVLWQIISRCAIKMPSPWTEELAGFLMIWLSLIGACAAFRRNSHLGVDFLATKFSDNTQLLIKSIASLCCALFSILILLTGGTELVWKTFITNQTSAVLGIKMGYIYLAVPISGFCLTLYSIQYLLIYASKYKTKQPL